MILRVNERSPTTGVCMYCTHWISVIINSLFGLDADVHTYVHIPEAPIPISLWVGSGQLTLCYSLTRSSTRARACQHQPDTAAHTHSAHMNSILREASGQWNVSVSTRPTTFPALRYTGSFDLIWISSLLPLDSLCLPASPTLHMSREVVEWQTTYLWKFTLGFHEHGCKQEIVFVTISFTNYHFAEEREKFRFRDNKSTIWTCGCSYGKMNVCIHNIFFFLCNKDLQIRNDV